MSDPVAEIKSKLSIEDVVSAYVPLKKAGKYLKACCPFHQEKTPSFHVNPERQIAYCFGCNKGGDMFQFIQEIEGLDFKGALELLADKANVELPKYHAGTPLASKDEKEELKEINSVASTFFVQNLWNGEAALKVLEYLKKRALTEESIREFEIGFAPDSYDLLYRKLLEKNYGKEKIIKTTLGIARDSTSQDVLDRFRLRLMFPIRNDRGDPVAFGGRALKKGEEPKYMNSSDYVLYNKGHILYNFDKAKKFVKESDFAVFVEGYFDVIASWQAGVKNVLATCGTALTEDQLKMVKRYTKKVVFAFDADKAGQDALLRSVLLAQPEGLDISVVTIPIGKDAADAVKENAQQWIDAVQNRLPYLQFYLNKYKTIYDLATSNGKKEFTDKMLELIEGASHPVEKDHYLKELSALVATPVELLYDLLNQYIAVKRRHSRSVSPKVESAPKKTKRERLFDLFTGLILSFPDEFMRVRDCLQNADVFWKKIEDFGFVRQIGVVDAENIKDFFDGLQKFLFREDFAINASHVYKELIDYYNLHAAIDEAFYEKQKNPVALKKLAFETELNNESADIARAEIEKVIILLYVEYSSNLKHNGKN
ncbi:DNA primase [Candidatus Peregrinibacteria bacterium]|nr:DNA primase [Candidatus Peregrinibacteria bacterium]